MKSKYEIQRKIDELYDVMGKDREPIINAKAEALEFLLGQIDPITDQEILPPKNDTEIDNLIKLLGQDKNKVPEYSAFGDPNWRQYDAQIEILNWVKEK